jgi:DNA-binding GntR family transcriptional regulator
MLTPLHRPLLSDTAHEQIRNAIIEGRLPPGSVIRDVDLAQQLGLSRAPVREALARLADERLVESKPQSWTRVTPLGVREVRDALAVVRAMHELVVTEAVPRMTPADITTMRQANARFAAAIRDADVARALEADDAVHAVCIDVAGNRAAAATIERYTPLIRRLERLRFASTPGRRSVRLHNQLIRACAQGDVPGAAAVTTRIWSTLDELLAEEPTETDHAERG